MVTPATSAADRIGSDMVTEIQSPWRMVSKKTASSIGQTGIRRIS